MITQAASDVNTALTSVRRAEETTLAEGRLLRIIAERPAKTLDIILPATYLGRNAAEDALNSLLAKRQIKQDPAGRLTLSERGLEKRRGLVTRTHEMESQVLAEVSERDLEGARRVLAAITRSEDPIFQP